MKTMRLIILIFLFSVPIQLCAQPQVRDSQYVASARMFFSPAVKYPAVALRPAVAPATYSASFINPGFFCRQEVKLDKKLPVPLRIRLGSVQYCNWLEQKPGYRGPQQ